MLRFLRRELGINSTQKAVIDALDETISLPGNIGAFVAPRSEPRSTSIAKEGIGTAYRTGCRLLFTLRHGIINEIYYAPVD